MRNARKLLLLAAGAMAAMAFVPSGASAQNVELVREQGGHCPAVVNAVGHRPSDTGCIIHAITEPGTTFDFYQHTVSGEMLFSGCSSEFEAAFNEAGVGFIYNQVLSPEGGSCGREVCDEAEGTPNPHRNIEWPARIRETTGTPTAEEERLTFTLCLYAHNVAPSSEGLAGTRCTLDLHVERTEHSYEFETPPHDGVGNGGAPCAEIPVIELEGHWVTTPSTPRHRGFLVRHLDDPVG